MIDWVKASLPLDWDTPITAGAFLRISPDGEVERCTVLSQQFRGSYDEHLTLRTVQRGFVEFDGNPTKFLQGHNVCGSDDLPGLVAAAMVKALGMAGREVPPHNLAQWLAGDFDVSRVDVAQMYELPSIADVRAWLRAACELARMKWRRANVRGTTLYFGKVEDGKRGSDWAIKAYGKADEINAAGRSHQLNRQLPYRCCLTAWVQNKLRVELMLRTGELKRYEGGRFRRASEWNEHTATAVFQRYFAKIELGTNAMLSPEHEDTLKPAMRLAYTAWKDGHDVAALLPERTFLRYKAKLLQLTGGAVDLSVPQAKSNVVPLVRVLELVPAAAPEFLQDVPQLLFRRAA